MEYINVHEMCSCEKKKGDKVRVNSGLLLKFAYLRSTSSKIGPCLGSAGMLSIIGIYSSGLNPEKVLNIDLRDAFLWTDFLLETYEIIFFCFV